MFVEITYEIVGRGSGSYKRDLKGESREITGCNHQKQGERMVHEVGSSWLLNAIAGSRVWGRVSLAANNWECGSTLLNQSGHVSTSLTEFKKYTSFQVYLTLMALPSLLWISLGIPFSVGPFIFRWWWLIIVASGFISVPSGIQKWEVLSSVLLIVEKEKIDFNRSPLHSPLAYHWTILSHIIPGPNPGQKSSLHLMSYMLWFLKILLLMGVGWGYIDQ